LIEKKLNDSQYSKLTRTEKTQKNELKKITLTNSKKRANILPNSNYKSVKQLKQGRRQQSMQVLYQLMRKMVLKLKSILQSEIAKRRIKNKSSKSLKPKLKPKTIKMIQMVKRNNKLFRKKSLRLVRVNQRKKYIMKLSKTSLSLRIGKMLSM
jgi:hypothetical protein